MNADGKTGKIVGLTEGTNKKWAPFDTTEAIDGIDSETDGATATKSMITAHKDDVNFATVYSAFEWVYTTVNGGNINGRWYLPAKEELRALYGNYSGDVKIAVNASLSGVSGAAQLSGIYWSSTQINANAWLLNFASSTGAGNAKNIGRGVRVVSAF